MAQRDAPPTFRLMQDRPSAGILTDKPAERPLPSPEIATVILNTDRCKDTMTCVGSLMRQTYERNRIIILDNCANLDCMGEIEARFPEVDIVRLSRNRGYAGNNNVGIDRAMELGVEWILILNEDVVLDPDAIECLMSEVALRSDVGFAGPIVYHYDEPDVIQSAGGLMTSDWLAYHRGQNEKDDGQYGQVQEVDWVSGCGILVRKAAIEQVGGLDDRYFYYWEETEWCLRGRRSGWKVLFVPKSRIWHKGVQRDYQPSPSTTYYWVRNWLMTLSKHQAPWSAWLFAGAWIARNLAAWTLLPRWSDKRDHRNAVLQGSMDFVRRRWGARPVGR